MLPKFKLPTAAIEKPEKKRIYMKSISSKVHIERGHGKKNEGLMAVMSSSKKRLNTENYFDNNYDYESSARPIMTEPNGDSNTKRSGGYINISSQRSLSPIEDDETVVTEGRNGSLAVLPEVVEDPDEMTPMNKRKDTIKSKLSRFSIL